MKKLISIILCFIGFHGSLLGQTGVNTRSPHPSVAVEVTATDKGVLLPKYTLNNLTSNSTPVNNPIVGALIYNQSGIHPKGYYYWDGSKWQRLIVNNEMVQILNLRILGSAPNRQVTPNNSTADNYVSFTAANGTQYINTLGIPNPNGTNITLPAGTYKADISLDCNSTGSTNTGLLAGDTHLYVTEAAIVNSSNVLLTDLKTISDISNFGGTSVQGYSFSFVFKLNAQQDVKVLLKNGSGATSNAAKNTNQGGISVNFYRMFQ